MSDQPKDTGLVYPAGDAPSGTSSRRSFLGVLVGIGTFLVGALLSIPLLRFALHPLLTSTTETGWSDVGAEDEFAGVPIPALRLVKVEQRNGWSKTLSDKAVYVANDGAGRLLVLSPVCSHLGCSISWNADNRQFVCPCHVGLFSADGSLISGPPPRNMDELESRIEGGRLEVRYQYFRQLVPTKEIIG